MYYNQFFLEAKQRSAPNLKNFAKGVPEILCSQKSDGHEVTVTFPSDHHQHPLKADLLFASFSPDNGKTSPGRFEYLGTSFTAKKKNSK